MNNNQKRYTHASRNEICYLKLYIIHEMMINLILYSSLVRTKLYGFRVLQTAAHIYDGKLYSRDEVFVKRICTRREAVACRCQGRSQQ